MIMQANMRATMCKQKNEGQRSAGVETDGQTDTTERITLPANHCTNYT